MAFSSFLGGLLKSLTLNLEWKKSFRALTVGGLIIAYLRFPCVFYHLKIKKSVTARNNINYM